MMTETGRSSRGGPWILLGLLLGSAGCCAPDLRQLDGSDRRSYRATRRSHFLPGQSPPELLESIVPGDIIAFTARESSSDGSTMLAAAVGEHTHVAIVFPHGREVRVLTANSEDGVIIQTLGRCIAGRPFHVYAFTEAPLNLRRLAYFARRAEFLGTFDYDWSAAVFGLNSNLTPNSLLEISGEYTCATAVAAALHYSGLSLDRAHCPAQFVGPADIIFSEARRNVNFQPSGER